MQLLLKVRLLCLLPLVVILAACNSGNTAVSQSGILYTPFNCPGSDNVSFPGISGIRQVTDSSDVYITGVYVKNGSTHAFVYQGPVLGGGVCNKFNYPSTPGVIDVTSTSLYGPDNDSLGHVTVVGSYTTSESGPVRQFGLLYQGNSDGSATSGYKTLDPQPLESVAVKNTIAHSTMGGLVVGAYDTSATNGKAFIYDINIESYESIVIGKISTTAYGIWWNGGESYTIAGGYSDVNESGIDIGYLVDYNKSTHQFTNLESYVYNDLSPSQVSVTHFEGITTDNKGGYNLAADWQYAESSSVTPSFVNVSRKPGGGFGTATWINFFYPGSSVTSANTVYLNNVLGLFTQSGVSGDFGYVATIPFNPS